MNRIAVGQVLMVLCCGIYLIWWYRGFRPGTNVSRVGGINGLLLLVTAALGIGGIVLSMTPIPPIRQMKASTMQIVITGIIVYVVLLIVTRYCFKRVVTTELILIVGWTVMETIVICRLQAAGLLSDPEFVIMSLILAAAFLVSIVLYVAYYRMEEMKAFYAAMIPLITEAVSMVILILFLLL